MKARIIFRIALFLFLMLPISSNAQMIRDTEEWAVIPLNMNKIVKVGGSTDCVYEMIKELGNRAGLLEKKILSKGEKYFSLQLAPEVDGYIHIYCTDWVRGYITEIEFYTIL